MSKALRINNRGFVIVDFEELETRLCAIIDRYSRAYEAADPEYGSKEVGDYAKQLEALGIDPLKICKELSLK